MVDKISNENLRFSYDKDTDVLYMSVGTPRECLGEMDDNGIIIKFDPQVPNMVIGITILDFQKRFSSPHAKPLPVNLTAQLQVA